MRPLEVYMLGWALTAAFELVRMWRKNLAGEMSDAFDAQLDPAQKVAIGEAKLHLAAFLICLFICSSVGSIWPIWIAIRLAGLLRRMKDGE